MIGEERIGARAEQKRRWDRENRPPCVACGQPRDRHNRSGLCHDCYRREERARVDARWYTIQRLWATGAVVARIADALGTTAGTIYTEVFRMRAAGWDLPYRYPRTGVRP